MKLSAALIGQRPLIQYELNEVPWRVIDWYLAQRPGAALAKVLQHSQTFTTVTTDEGELHPWTTWPTFHRGVDNRRHKIRFLNQDKSCGDPFPPIWEEVAKAGLKVGVFGSMQSYPVPADRTYAFYVPDTFAAGPETHPPAYSAFQRVNLRQTRADGAEAATIRLDGSLGRDLLGLPGIGVSPATFIRLAGQLLREGVDRRHKTRRAMLQAPLSFDVFRHALNRTEPDFATFFTNHVAGVMHRYWKFAFPEDFGFQSGTFVDDFHRESLLVAMDIADAQIGRLKAYVDDRGGQLVIASSMGQEAIDRGEYRGELRITDATKFMQVIGFHYPFVEHLAMQPDFNLEFRNVSEREEFCRLVTKLVDRDGNSLFKRIRWEGPTVNLGLGTPRDVLERERLLIEDAGKGVREIALREAGLRKLWRDPGTGYHQPYGSLIWYQSQLRGLDARTEINSTDVRNMILAVLAVAPRETAEGPPINGPRPRAPSHA